MKPPSARRTRSFAVSALVVAVLACGRTAAPVAPADPREGERIRMVADQIEARGVKDPRVLAAMRKVPRHEFVPAAQRPFAYEDRPLPIDADQTISQPYIVALMTELAKLDETSNVLEIGTGSGYAAAVLAEIAATVTSIEIVESLADSARATLARTGYTKVKVIAGDGYRGWPERAPFDAILVTAAPPAVPQPLKEQLKIGGRLVVPVGETYQQLMVITRTADGWTESEVLPVMFVPMTGEAQSR